jgi:hypothetical protein
LSGIQERAIAGNHTQFLDSRTNRRARWQEGGFSVEWGSQVCLASAMSLLCISPHGRRVWVCGSAATASPVRALWPWRGTAAWSGRWRQNPQRAESAFG